MAVRVERFVDSGYSRFLPCLSKTMGGQPYLAKHESHENDVGCEECIARTGDLRCVRSNS